MSEENPRAKKPHVARAEYDTPAWIMQTKGRDAKSVTAAQNLLGEFVRRWKEERRVDDRIVQWMVDALEEVSREAHADSRRNFDYGRSIARALGLAKGRGREKGSTNAPLSPEHNREFQGDAFDMFARGLSLADVARNLEVRHIRPAINVGVDRARKIVESCVRDFTDANNEERARDEYGADERIATRLGIGSTEDVRRIRKALKL